MRKRPSSDGKNLNNLQHVCDKTGDLQFTHFFAQRLRSTMLEDGASMTLRALDTGDSKSTGALRRHAKMCWGEANVTKADQSKDIDAARDALKGAVLRDGSITAVFERTGKGKVTLMRIIC